MSAAVTEGTARRNGSASQPKSAESASEVHEGQRAVVIVGLLQFAPGAALRGLAFSTVNKSLKAAAFPGKQRSELRSDG